MFAASWIEARLAMWACVIGSHIIGNTQLVTADSTENCFLIKFSLGPNLMFVIGFFLMAGKAGIVFIAAFEFDCDDIQVGMPMNATGLVVHWLTKNANSLNA